MYKSRPRRLSEGDADIRTQPSQPPTPTDSIAGLCRPRRRAHFPRARAVFFFFSKQLLRAQALTPPVTRFRNPFFKRGLTPKTRTPQELRNPCKPSVSHVEGPGRRARASPGSALNRHARTPSLRQEAHVKGLGFGLGPSNRPLASPRP